MRISIYFPRLVLLLAGLISVAGLAPAAYSGNDFSALLEDLSFGSSELAPSVLRSADQDQVAASLQSAKSVAHRAITLPPMVALSAPVANQAPVTVGTKFNLSAAAALQTQELNHVTLVGCVGNRHGASNGCDAGGCDCGGCDGGVSCASGRCGGGQCVSGQCSCNPGVSMPRRPVQLPSNSFLGHFSSDPCHTGVWDNYSRRCNRLYEDCEPCKKKKRGCGDWWMCVGGGCGEILPPMPKTQRVRRIHVPRAEPWIGRVACDSCDG